MFKNFFKEEPIPDLMEKSVKSFLVKPCHRKEIESFIVNWHYSKNMNGIVTDYCFKLIYPPNHLIGAMVYGKIAMANVWKKYADNFDDLIELRRLCCIDDTPKNTESYFIGKTLKWLKKNTNLKIVLSYADQTHNHSGIIYKASNFEHLGVTNKGKMIQYNNKLYHDKTIRTYYNGKLKPYAEKLKTALDNGEAKYIDTKGKNIYIYRLRK